jgi:MFS transporter, ACS family, glucarate transporter
MRRNPWPWVGLLCATATASYISRVNVSVAGALLMKEFGFSQPQMGRIFSAFLVGYAGFMVPAGMISDRWGTSRVLAVASWWWVLTTGLLMLVGLGPWVAWSSAALTGFMVLRFVLGVGESPTFPASARGLARWIPPAQQGRANGFVNAAIGLGSAIAPPLLSAVMVRWGWRAALAVSALPAVATALGWQKAKEPPPLEPEKPEDGPISQPETASLRSRSFVLLTASYTLQGYVGYIFVFWFYLYLVQVRHFDLLRGAFLSSLPWILSVVSIPLGGWVSDRIVARKGLVVGRRAVPLAGLALAGVFLSLGARTTNGYVAVVYLALSTAMVLCVEGPFWATMMEIARGRSGTGGGIMNMGSNLGGVVSPVLTPVLAEIIGWENALHVAAALAVVAALLWLGIRPEGRLPVER